MTGKRYFKRMWEEEYYIFDSETITEKEVDEKVEYDNDVFADAMWGDTVVDRLNELHEENKRLKAYLVRYVDKVSYDDLEEICNDERLSEWWSDLE